MTKLATGMCIAIVAFSSLGLANEELCLPMVRPDELIYENTLSHCTDAKTKASGMAPGSSLSEVVTNVDSKKTKFRIFKSDDSQINVQFDSENKPKKVVISDTYRNSLVPVYSITSISNGAVESEVSCRNSQSCTAVSQKICDEILAKFKGGAAEISACFSNINTVQEMISNEVKVAHRDVEENGPFQDIKSKIGHSFKANQNYNKRWVRPYEMIRVMNRCLSFQESKASSTSASGTDSSKQRIAR